LEKELYNDVVVGGIGWESMSGVGRKLGLTKERRLRGGGSEILAARAGQ